MFMVSFQARYETSSSNTNFPQALFLANTGNIAHVAASHWTQFARPAHHSKCDRPGTRAGSDGSTGTVCASFIRAWAGLRHIESG